MLTLSWIERITCLLLRLLLLFFYATVLPCMAGEFDNGEGTAGNPYQISTITQLQAVSKFLDKHFKLTQNIDALQTRTWNSGKGFSPIGSVEAKFTGIFDGCGYRIVNLYVNRGKTNFVGLFACVGQSGKISNVKLENIEIIAANVSGGLAGWNWGYISNSYTMGKINGTGELGGLAGFNFGVIENSFSSCTVKSAGNYAGGLVGWNVAMVKRSYADGSVTGNNRVGGLVGENHFGNIITSYSGGTVSGNQYVGCLAGLNWGTISNSYATGKVTGKSNIGGLIGSNYGGSISKTYSISSVKRIAKCKNNESKCGGLIGSNEEPTVILDSFWDKEISGTEAGDGGTSKTSNQMKDIKTYTDKNWSDGLTDPWKFNRASSGIENDSDAEWSITSELNNGYPYLLSISIKK